MHFRIVRSADRNEVEVSVAGCPRLHPAFILIPALNILSGTDHHNVLLFSLDELMCFQLDALSFDFSVDGLYLLSSNFYCFAVQ
jgi:hypothetical protein